MRDIHVLIIPSGYPSFDSPLRGVFFREQAIALRQSGLRVGVIYPELRSLRSVFQGSLLKNRFQIESGEDDGVQTIRCLGWNLFPRLPLTYTLWHRMVLRLYSEYVKDNGTPDLVHAHGSIWAGMSALEISALSSIPFAITEHSSAVAKESFPRWVHRLLAPTIHRADIVLAVSESLRRSMIRIAPGKAIDVVPNLVDEDFFDLSLREAMVDEGDPFVFLTVSGLNQNKGHDVLLRAFAAEFRGDVCVRLHIGGDGPLRGILERTAEQLGIRTQVSFLGPLSRDGVRNAMSGAHSYVSASYVETFGVALVEALFCGLPVVSTRSGGPNDFVEQSNGILCEPGSVSALAGALVEMRHKWATYDPAAIRALAVGRYSKKAVCGMLISKYAAVLERN